MAGSGSQGATDSTAGPSHGDPTKPSYAMSEYLKDQDQRKAFLAGTRGANPPNLKGKLTEIQADCDNVGNGKNTLNRNPKK